MIDITKDYGEDFFAMHEPWHEEYCHVARTLMKTLRFGSVLDIGCGCGYIISYMEERGREVLGVDGSEMALKYRPDTVITDLRMPLSTSIYHYDLVICTEVAEHLPENCADIIVDSICNASRDLVFFSAATPGHGGHLHLNEQMPEYWIEKFAQRNFVLQKHLTELICNDLEQKIEMIWWFKNGYVLRKKRA